MAKRGTPWSESEVEVILASYFRMLQAELTGAHYVKASENRGVDRLIGRGKGSIEFKYANISAALDEVGMVYIDGYKPMRNIQDSLRQAVAEYIEVHPEINAQMKEFIDKPVFITPDLFWNPAPVEIPDVGFADRSRGREFLPRQVDYVAREAANRITGEAGELLVLAEEREVLEQAGRKDLARKVRHVSKEDGDGTGFDILSFSLEGDERYLEVKTTKRGINAPFFVTPNEVNRSAVEDEAYELHRLFGLNTKRSGRYVLNGSLEETCILLPNSYSALPITA